MFATDPRPSGITGRLDKVECARGMATKKLIASARRLNMMFAVALITLLVDDSGFAQILGEQTQRARKLVFTNEKYAEHFEQLKEATLLEEVDAGEIIFCNTYFSIPKSSKEDRAIFNGKKVSRCFTTPPSTNIMDVPRILAEMSTLHTEEGAWMVVGDIRHCFHQHEVPGALARFFGLCMKISGVIRCFVWRGLPMGWSWSPAIAQACSWTMIAHREPGEWKLIDLDNTTTSPLFARVLNDKGDSVGFVTIYYDNYVALLTCPRTAESLSHRIRRNAEYFSVVLKEHKLWTKKEMCLDRNPDKALPTFLGIEMALCSKRNRDGSCKYVLQWRQKIKDATLPHLATSVTPRECARVVGMVLYSRLLTLAPLGLQESTRGILQLLRRVSIEAWRTSWSSEIIQLSEKERHDIREEWACMTSRGWIEKTPPPSRVAYACTDACDKGWAALVLSSEGKVIHCTGMKEFPSDMKDDHIYLKELYACLEGIRLAQLSMPGCDGVVVVVDNTAVAGTLRRRYSSNHKANSMLANLTCKVHVITVPSDANAADDPSRGSEVQERRLQDTWKAIVMDKVGQKNGQAQRHPNHQEGGIRHLEGEDDDLLLDALSVDADVMQLWSEPSASTGIRR